jgi:hypothetical protein
MLEMAGGITLQACVRRAERILLWLLAGQAGVVVDFRRNWMFSYGMYSKGEVAGAPELRQLQVEGWGLSK